MRWCTTWSGWGWWRRRGARRWRWFESESWMPAVLDGGASGFVVAEVGGRLRPTANGLSMPGSFATPFGKGLERCVSVPLRYPTTYQASDGTPTGRFTITAHPTLPRVGEYFCAHRPSPQIGPAV